MRLISGGPLDQIAFKPIGPESAENTHGQYFPKADVTVKIFFSLLSVRLSQTGNIKFYLVDLPGQI